MQELPSKKYNLARKKMIDMLVTRSILNIQGGRITLCNEKNPGMQCGRCRRKKEQLRRI